MTDSIDRLVDSLYSSLAERDKRKKTAYDTPAEVTRISDDGQTVWVHIDNGLDETPVQRTNNARVGDLVMIRVANGKAWLLGNRTNPATDDATALEATRLAKDAASSAESAQNSAQIAYQAAGQAMSDAAIAHDAATTAVQKAEQAIEDAEAAQTAAETAATSASNAETSASQAATSASNAESSASTAATAATNAASSAATAATAASNAESQATASAQSASRAATSASNAETSASQAATSASNAETSASQAATAASNAESEAAAASQAATNAQTSASNAGISASQAQAASEAAQLAALSTITTDTIHYLATSLSSGVTRSTPGWTTTVQSMTATNNYLWTYHTYTKASGGTVDTDPVITGTYGKDGAPGQDGAKGDPGQDGDDGVSVTAVQPQYYLSVSESSASGGSWSNSLAYIPGKYIWTRDMISYSNNTSAPSTAIYNEALTQSCADAAEALGLVEEQQEYFWHDTLGAHVLSSKDTTATRYRTDLKGGGQEVFRVGSEADISVAKFGADGSRIGKEYIQDATDNESHLKMDYHSFRMVDKENREYVWFSDLRDRNGKYTYSYTHIRNYNANIDDEDEGRRLYHYEDVSFPYKPDDPSAITVTIDGQPWAIPEQFYDWDIDDTKWVDNVKYYKNAIEFFLAPESGSTIVVQYVHGDDGTEESYSTTGDGSTKVFVLTDYVPYRTFLRHVFINNVEVSGLHLSSMGKYVYIDGDDIPDGAEMIFTFVTSDPSLKCFTIGTRVDGASVGSHSHAFGYKVDASGTYSYAEGYYTTASGDYSHAEGCSTEARATFSHAEGHSAKAIGVRSHAEGSSKAYGKYSHSEGGEWTKANGDYSHAEGHHSEADGFYSHVEGYFCNAEGKASHSEGDTTKASGKWGSHAEGYYTIASGDYGSHAEGAAYTTTDKFPTASGNYGSHAEGYGEVIASGDYGSHAEGFYTTASGAQGSHAEGHYSTASGSKGSHAEGYYTIASGDYGSHAEGYYTRTTETGWYAHAEGYYTIAAKRAQHAMGKFNIEDTDTGDYGKYALIIGNGTADNYRSDAFRVGWDGQVEAISKSNISHQFVARRTDTGVTARFGVGSGGTNHGVWSDKLNKWMIYADNSNIYVDGRAMSPIAYGVTLPSTFAASTFLIRKYGAVVTITLNNVSKAEVGNNVLFTLPAGWRPPAVTAAVIIAPAAALGSGAQNLALRLSVQTNGEVAIYNYRSSAITNSTNAGGVLTYIATS